MGWNWPGTLLLVDSLRETRVTEPPWVMFVTNLWGNMIRWKNRCWWRIKKIEELRKLFMVIILTVDLMLTVRFPHLEPGSCDLDLLTGFAILSLRADAPIPLTLDADLPKLVPVGPILTMDTPSSTNVSSRFELLLDAVALSWRFVG